MARPVAAGASRPGTAKRGILSRPVTRSNHALIQSRANDEDEEGPTSRSPLSRGTSSRELTEEEKSDQLFDEAVLQSFYGKYWPKFANKQKSQKVIASFKKRAGPNGDWRLAMYTALEQQWGEDPVKFFTAQQVLARQAAARQPRIDPYLRLAKLSRPEKTRRPRRLRPRYPPRLRQWP